MLQIFYKCVKIHSLLPCTDKHVELNAMIETYHEIERNYLARILNIARLDFVSRACLIRICQILARSNVSLILAVKKP